MPQQRYVSMLISIPADASSQRFRAMLNTFAAVEGCTVLQGGESGLDYFLKRKAGPTAAEIERVEQMADAYVAHGHGAVAKSGGAK